MLQRLLCIWWSFICLPFCQIEAWCIVLLLVFYPSAPVGSWTALVRIVALLLPYSSPAEQTLPAHWVCSTAKECSRIHLTLLFGVYKLWKLSVLSCSLVGQTKYVRKWDLELNWVDVMNESLRLYWLLFWGKWVWLLVWSWQLFLRSLVLHWIPALRMIF